MRTSPDVAYNADPNTGYWVYDSFRTGGNAWRVVGGTSAGAPQWSALVAIANQGRAAEGLAPLNGPTQTLPLLYQTSPAAFHSIQNQPAYSLATGRGSPYADRVAAALAGELLGSGQTLTAALGQSFTGVVATFADYTGSGGSYSALINWGNGTTTQGQVVSLGNGQYQVVGTNTYAAAGSYTIRVQIQGSAVVPATLTATAQVDPSLSFSSQPVAAPAGMPAPATGSSPTAAATSPSQPSAPSNAGGQSAGAASPGQGGSSNDFYYLLYLWILEMLLSG
jgi:hypothetical protein